MTENLNEILNLKEKIQQDNSGINESAKNFIGFYRFLGYLIIISGIIFILIGLNMKIDSYDKNLAALQSIQKTTVIISSIFYTIFGPIGVFYKALLIELTAKAERNTRKQTESE